MAKMTMPTSIQRHKYFDEDFADALGAKKYSVDDLRSILKGWTWQKLLEHHQRVSPECGVMFHGRIGRFMGKPCIAVCALGHIVVLKYLDTDQWAWATSSVIDGTRHGGVLLFAGDFLRLTGDIKLTDQIIESEP